MIKPCSPLNAILILNDVELSLKGAPVKEMPQKVATRSQFSALVTTAQIAVRQWGVMVRTAYWALGSSPHSAIEIGCVTEPIMVSVSHLHLPQGCCEDGNRGGKHYLTLP